MQQQKNVYSSKIDHTNVSKLYDLCVKNLIKNSLESIIKRNNNDEELRLRIKLPATLCDSILAEYFINYENKVRQFERNEYFMLNQLLRQYKKNEAELSDLHEQIESFIRKNSSNNKLISSYDLLKCLSNELSLSTVIYKQCLRTQTPLHERLKKILKTKSPIFTPSLIEHVNKILNLRITSNPRHLNDSDFERMLCRNRVEYLDICPCLLTNRVVFLINSNLKCLKYLKLQNYCDWSHQDIDCGRLFQIKKQMIKEEVMIDDGEEEDDDEDEDGELVQQEEEEEEEINENIEFIDDSSSSDDENEKTISKILKHFKNNTEIRITSNIQEMLKNLMNRKIFQNKNSNFFSILPSFWVNKQHLDSSATTTATAAASTSSHQKSTTDYDDDLYDFFLNEQKSTSMNEEQVEKYLVDLKLLADKHDVDGCGDGLCSKFNVEQLHILNLENLQYLSLKGLDSCLTASILNDILGKFKQLKYLDLTSCFKSTTAAEHMMLSPKRNLVDSLKHLIFSNFNVDELTSNIDFILCLRNINYLDVSNYREKNLLNTYKNPSRVLARLVFYLKNLQSLDISGTNLGGADMFKLDEEIEYIKVKLEEDMSAHEDDEDFKRERLEFLSNISAENCNESNISGLLFLNSKLSFLGCLNCDQNVSARERIPACRIAGESKEEYLFTCLEVYLDKSLFILDSLNHLFELYKEGMIDEKQHGGHLIMNCMQKYLNHSRIQISGSASLFYVLKYSKEDNKILTPFYIRRLVDTIINAMEEHIDENAVSCFLGGS